MHSRFAAGEVLAAQISAGNWLIFKAHGVERLGGRQAVPSSRSEISYGSRDMYINRTLILLSWLQTPDSPPLTLLIFPLLMPTFYPISNLCPSLAPRKSHSRIVIRLCFKSCSGNIEKLRTCISHQSIKVPVERPASSEYGFRWKIQSFYIFRNFQRIFIVK